MRAVCKQVQRLHLSETTTLPHTDAGYEMRPANILKVSPKKSHTADASNAAQNETNYQARQTADSDSPNK